MDITPIDARLRYLDRQLNTRPYERKKEALRLELETFLSRLPTPRHLGSASPQDLRRFLVEKDKAGRTKVHGTHCPHLGQHGMDGCPCPKRLASGTVEVIIGQMKGIFAQHGRGQSWDTATLTGNPAYAADVSRYLKAVQQEQSAAHVTPRQAKPLFTDKLRSIAAYIDREVVCPCSTATQIFILMRDQAFLKLQFFAGDRASDLGRLMTQEVRRLPGNRGFMIRHTSGKCFTKDKANTFAVYRCADPSICPVTGLQRYVEMAGTLGIHLGPGHLFRLTQDGKVLNDPITYDAIYDRLKSYLTTLNIYAGETPHSLRGGCAVTLEAAGASPKQMMHHVGWASPAMPRRYARADRVVDGQAAEKLAGMAADGTSNENAKEKFESMDYDNMALAFQQ